MAKLSKTYRLDEKIVQAIEKLSLDQDISMASIIESAITIKAFRQLDVNELDKIFGDSMVSDILELKEIDKFKRS